MVKGNFRPNMKFSAISCVFIPSKDLVFYRICCLLGTAASLSYPARWRPPLSTLPPPASPPGPPSTPGPPPPAAIRPPDGRLLCRIWRAALSVTTTCPKISPRPALTTSMSGWRGAAAVKRGAASRAIKRPVKERQRLAAPGRQLATRGPCPMPEVAK
jgi:hypothetical protein